MSAADLFNIRLRWPWSLAWLWGAAKRTKTASEVPYIWVNFEIDIVDIGLQRFSLPSGGVGHKIKRVRYKSLSESVEDTRALEVLMEGRYLFPGVWEAEIECFHPLHWVQNGPWWRVTCGVEGVVCIDSRPGRMGRRVRLEELCFGGEEEEA